MLYYIEKSKIKVYENFKKVSFHSGRNSVKLLIKKILYIILLYIVLYSIYKNVYV